MSALGAMITIDVEDGRADETAALLARMARSAAQDEGTDVFDVCHDVDRPGRFYLYERYRDRDAFRRHRANTELAELGRGLRALAVHMEITRLSVLPPPGPPGR